MRALCPAFTTTTNGQTGFLQAVRKFYIYVIQGDASAAYSLQTGPGVTPPPTPRARALRLPAIIDHEAAAVAFTRLVDLASEHELTVYDATYIELATRRQMPLASNDARMKQAATRSGVELWQFEAS